jgi:hypothetical protein
MTTCAELQEYAKEYHDAVREHETSLFVSYIASFVRSLARNGHLSVAYPVLPKGALLLRTAQGLLNKEDMGPLQANYVDGVIHGLNVLFPDMNIFLTLDETKILLDWSSAKRPTAD